MALERIVRPYQTRANTPPIKLEVANTVDPQPITLQIGKNGSGKTLTGSYSSSLSVYMEKAAVENTKTPSKLSKPPSEVTGSSFAGSV